MVDNEKQTAALLTVICFRTMNRLFALNIPGCIIAAIILISCRHEPHLNIANGKDTLLIYVMAGQSNMAGRGAVGAKDTIPDPRILAMNKDNCFVPAREPLHYFYQPGLSGLDCGMSFARNMLPYIPANARVGLIPCAMGSTSIEDWRYDQGGIVPLYSAMMTRTRAGMQQGVVKGILWHQGESNAEDSTYKNYEDNLQALILKWRSDLNNPELPVFLGKLAPFYKKPYTDSINAAIERTSEKLPHVYVIETAGLTCKPDSTHFDAEAQRLLGARFAEYARLKLH